MKMLESLNNHNSQQLQAMLSALGEKRIPTIKAERAARLHQIWLLQPSRILDACSDEERLLLADMVHNDRKYPDLVQFRALYDVSYRLPYYRGYEAALIWMFFEVSKYDSGKLLDETVEVLKRLLPPPPDLKVKSCHDLPQIGVWRFESSWREGEARVDRRELNQHDAEQVALTELRRVLQLTAAGKIKVSDATRYPTAGTVKQVATVLAAPDLDLTDGEGNSKRARNKEEPGPVRPFIWPVLIQQCGWARYRQGILQLTSSGKKMLAEWSPADFDDGIAKWLEDTTFDEMRRVAAVKGQTGKKAMRCRVSPEVRRNSILDALALLPAGEWVEIEEVHRVVLASGGDCRVVLDGYCLYAVDTHYGALASHTYELGRIYLRQVLGESLATLGLIDIAYATPYNLHPELHDTFVPGNEPYTSLHDGLKFVRVTPLGRFALGLDDSYTPPVPENQSVLTVLPNLEVAVTDPAAFSPADAMQLSSFAVKTSDAVWRLDRAQVMAALERGDTPQHILEVLSGLARNEVPDTVRQFIEDIGARAGAASQREAAELIHFADEQTAALVMTDSAAGKTALCRHRNTVVVPAKRIRAFATALKKMGILLPT